MDEVRVLATGLRFPEGPAVDSSGRLWCAEQGGGGVFCLHADGQTDRIATGGQPGGLTLDNEGNVWFCDSGQQAIRRLRADTRHVETVLDNFNGKPLNYPSNLIFDRVGSLLFTCSGPPAGEADPNQPQGIVLVITGDGLVQIVADELDYPSGLAFIPGTDTLLITETRKQRVWSGFWDETTPSWDTITVWTNTGDELDRSYGPGGLAVGPDGTVYATMFGTGMIKVFNADGEFIRTIVLPGQKPTNCVVNADGHFLIVTEAERGELLQIAV